MWILIKHFFILNITSYYYRKGNNKTWLLMLLEALFKLAILFFAKLKLFSLVVLCVFVSLCLFLMPFEASFPFHFQQNWNQSHYFICLCLLQWEVYSKFLFFLTVIKKCQIQGQQLSLPSFKGTMKSSTIKAVTQTQFKTCVTAVIALDFNLRRGKLSRWDLRKFPCSKAIL